jgi:hypothetical protein
MRGGHDQNGWCILRTSSTRTLALAASLSEAGYEAWTPTEKRARLAGADRKLVEQELAILPGYVFARIARVSDLLALARSPSLAYQVWDSDRRKMVTKGHPHFSVFHQQGQVRGQSEVSLAPLRAIEASLQRDAERRRTKNAEKGDPPRFEEGQIVRVNRAGYEGLELRVAERNVGKDVTLSHPDWMWDLEISAWQLERIQLEQRATALAA